MRPRATPAIASAAWTSQQIIEAFANQNPPPVSPPRSRSHLRQRSSFADCITADGTRAHRAPESLAKSVRRTADRLDSKRVPGSLRDRERTSEADPDFIFRSLPRVRDALGARQ